MVGSSLPNELLTQIFMHVRTASGNSWNEDVKTKTLCSIYSASKAFNQLSAPAFYHTVSTTDNKRTPVGFLIFAAQRPQILQWVETLDFQRGFETRKDRDPSWSAFKVFDGLIDPLKHASPSSSLPELVLQGLYDGDPDSQVAASLLLCSNLSALSIPSFIDEDLPERDWCPPFQSSILNSLFEEAELNIARTYLTKLRTFKQNSSAQFFLQDLLDYSVVFSLPSLESFVGTSLVQETSMTVNFPTFNLRSLSLVNFMLAFNGLESVLSHFPSLENFTIELGTSMITLYGRRQELINLSFLTKGLTSDGHSLQRFVLRAVGIDRECFKHEPPVSGSLQEMTNLKHVTMPASALFGSGMHAPGIGALTLAQILPFSLRSLSITEMQEEEEVDLIDSRVKDLTEDARFSSLRKVTVGVEDFDSLSDERINSAFESMFPAETIIWRDLRAFKWIKDGFNRWTRHERHLRVKTSQSTAPSPQQTLSYFEQQLDNFIE